jgi:hypothetical protein
MEQYQRKICLTIPIYLRGKKDNRAVATIIKHYSSLGLPLHLCGSEGALSRDYCKPFISDLVKYVEVPQERFSKASGGDEVLRKKFNDSIATHGPGYDWYCMMGADDIVSLSTFDKLPDTEEPTMAGVSMDSLLLIYEIATGPTNAFSVTIKYNRPFKLLPGLNAFNRAAMDLCDWKPYNRNGCETGAELYFREFGDVVPLPGYVVMVKEGAVLNSVQAIKRRHPWRKVSGEQLALLREVLA